MRSSPLVALAVAAAILMPAQGARGADCPTAVSFTPAGTGSTADTGWTGVTLARPIFGNTLDLAISCPSASPPCGTCAIVDALPDPLGIFQRCADDTSIKCTVATETADCGGPGTCRIFLTVPQWAATAGVVTCYTNEITGPVTGTVDESGAMTVAVEYTGKIYNGLIGRRACPSCEDDPVPNNGVQSGHCVGGPRDGLPCDAHGVPPAPYEDVGISSFDCPPNPATLIGTLSPGPVTFSTGVQTRTLTAASPNCSGAPGSKCFCDTCNDAAADPCQSDADCPPSGGNPGICGGLRCAAGANHGAPCASNTECPGSACGRPGEPTKPNACVDDDCQDTAPLGDGIGECASGPVVVSCVNHPNRGCVFDSDCDNVPGSCQESNRLCYLTHGTIGESIGATGVATPPVAHISDPTTLGMITCQRASHVPIVDSLVGLPGLARNHHAGTLAFGQANPGFDGDCPVAPDTCRAPTIPGKSQLQLEDRTPDAKDQLKWRWTKGAATTLAELGDPTTTDDYVLCGYDAHGLRITARIPAGGTCDGRPCWKTVAHGFLYKRKDGFPRGITQLVLKSGLSGKSQIRAAGRGVFLAMPSLASIAAPLEVQLRNRTSGLCWEATYPAPLAKSTATELKARD